MRKILVEYLPGLIGGVVGGVLGFYVFRWLLVNYSLFAPVLPGAFTGLLCGLLSRSPVLSRNGSCSNLLFRRMVHSWIMWRSATNCHFPRSSCSALARFSDSGGEKNAVCEADCFVINRFLNPPKKIEIRP
jgi:hypothetical protein